MEKSRDQLLMGTGSNLNLSGMLGSATQPLNFNFYGQRDDTSPTNSQLLGSQSNLNNMLGSSFNQT